MMMELDMVTVVFDSDEHMYPLEGESEKAFEDRMEILRTARASRMTEEDRYIVEQLLRDE